MRTFLQRISFPFFYIEGILAGWDCAAPEENLLCNENNQYGRMFDEFSGFREIGSTA